MLRVLYTRSGLTQHLRYSGLTRRALPPPASLFSTVSVPPEMDHATAGTPASNDGETVRFQSRSHAAPLRSLVYNLSTKQSLVPPLNDAGERSRLLEEDEFSQSSWVKQSNTTHETTAVIEEEDVATTQEDSIVSIFVEDSTAESTVTLSTASTDAENSSNILESETLEDTIAQHQQFNAQEQNSPKCPLIEEKGKVTAPFSSCTDETIAPQQSADHDQQTSLTKERQHPLMAKLLQYVSSRNHKKAMATFYEIREAIRYAEQHGEEPPAVRYSYIKALFRLVQPRQPFDCYDVFKFYRTLPDTPEYAKGDINGFASMYGRLCDSLRHMNLEKHSLTDCKHLVRSVVGTVQRLDRAGQELCCPVLLSALLDQRSVRIGSDFCPAIYQYIHEQKIAVPDGWYLHLLGFSKFHRQRDIPFADVLERAVERGRRPSNLVVLNVLDNFYPFTDTATVARVLQSILKLQQLVVEDASRDGMEALQNQYYVDIGTLEVIGAAASSQGQSDVSLLVWDMLDLLGYEPTVGIYENTVVAFAMSTFTYREAFTVLIEMEARGFKPSRALIRSFSTLLR